MSAQQFQIHNDPLRHAIYVTPTNEPSKKLLITSDDQMGLCEARFFIRKLSKKLH